MDRHIRKRICLVPIGIGLDNCFHGRIPSIEIHGGIWLQKSACLRPLHSHIKGLSLPHRIKNVHTRRVENPAELQQLSTTSQQFTHLQSRQSCAGRCSIANLEPLLCRQGKQFFPMKGKRRFICGHHMHSPFQSPSDVRSPRLPSGQIWRQSI